jgi:hypothetical protein
MRESYKTPRQIVRKGRLLKRVASLLLLFLAFGLKAIAGQVYGRIFHNDEPTPGMQLELQCSDESTSGQTDDEGVYRLFVRATGECMVVARVGDQRAEGRLYSYDRPTEYDFDLIVQEGQWRLVPRQKY